MGKDRNRLETKAETTTGFTDPRVEQQAWEFFERGFQPYGGERVAPLAPQTQTAIGQLEGLEAPQFNMGAYQTASGLLGDVANQGRIVDENGFLGAISDYSNPYIQQVLEPIYAKLNEENAKRQMAIGNKFNQLGGRNDARQGVAEGEQHGRYMDALSAATGQVYSDAWQQAMGLRGQDLSRRGNLAQQYTQIAGAENSAATQQFNGKLQQIQALVSAGQMTQQQAQNELDADYQEYLMQLQDEYDRYAALLSASGQTVTEMGPRGYPFLELLGTVAGSALGSRIG